MSVILRAILIIGSAISFILCVKKIKEAKLKVENSIVWLLGSLLLILMSIFSTGVEWISTQLGFEAPVNFVFVAISTFLLIEVYLNNLKLTELNEKIKNLNHYIALEKFEESKERGEKDEK